MVVLLVWKDGTEEIVDRCFMVESRARRRWRTRFVAQRQPGTPLRWFRPQEVERVNYDRPDLLTNEPPRKAV